MGARFKLLLKDTGLQEIIDWTTVVDVAVDV